MTKEPRVILFDLEFFHLNWGADLGTIFCMGWKVLGEKQVHVESVWDTHQSDELDDKELCVRIKEILSEADLLVTYNGIKCDVPFIQTRLLHHNIAPLQPIAHKDVYYTAVHKLKLSRNRLYDVQTFLNLKNEKSPVNLLNWIKALVGNNKSQKDILYHCKQDVAVLEDAYMKLRPLMQAHPRIHGIEGCNKCGGHLIKRGLYITTGKNPKQRYSCSKCGGWETRPITKRKNA